MYLVSAAYNLLCLPCCLLISLSPLIPTCHVLRVLICSHPVLRTLFCLTYAHFLSIYTLFQERSSNVCFDSSNSIHTVTVLTDRHTPIPMQMQMSMLSMTSTLCNVNANANECAYANTNTTLTDKRSTLTPMPMPLMTFTPSSTLTAHRKQLFSY